MFAHCIKQILTHLSGISSKEIHSPSMCGYVFLCACRIHAIDTNLDREIDSDDVRADVQWCENECLQKTRCRVIVLCEFSGLIKRLNYEYS